MKNIVISLASLAMIIGFVVLFIAASKDRNKSACRGIHLEVEGNPAVTFINKGAITRLLQKDRGLNPVGKQLSDIRIRSLEQAVKTFPWVRDAELYVDNDNLLQITVTERVPVARVFMSSGYSFFLDATGIRLPVTGSFAVKLPVFTGFPDDQASAGPADSLLLSGMIALSGYLKDHPFWMAQVDQISINRDREFEIVPAVGDALIEFGAGKDIPEKFAKLMVFYRQGLNNIGWGYYDTLDLRYRGQIVATRKRANHNPVVDSLMTRNSYASAPGLSPEGQRRQSTGVGVPERETKK